jgi:hypothetical protein
MDDTIINLFETHICLHEFRVETEQQEDGRWIAVRPAQNFG